MSYLTHTHAVGRKFIGIILFIFPLFTYAQNDLCSNAIPLVSGTACVSIPGTLKSMTASVPADGVPAGCGDPNAIDVWYTFVAESAYPTISLSSVGSNIISSTAGNGNGARIQLLSGICGSFTQLACTATPMNTSTALITGRALVPGTTYYIRITTLNNSAGTAGANWGYAICITDPPATIPPPRFGNSYVNLSKKNTGGVVEKGDTLEIRMTINLTTGVQYRTRYLDNVPVNTQMLTGTNDSIRVVTNEGLTYKNYTLAPGDDAATYLASAPAGEYNIRMNLGFGTGMPAPSTPSDNSLTSITGARQMSSSARPLGGGKLLFATSFRVVVTGNPGDVITLGTGKFVYRSSPVGSDTALSTIPYQILISTPQALCANSTGVNSAQEFGGTFGSGTTLNRTTPPDFPIPSYTLVNASGTQAVGDGTYAIVKNLSPINSTNRTALRQPFCSISPIGLTDSCRNRMFSGFWFIDGDHTGTSDGTGNVPPGLDDPGGYMLMVNADYVASEAYRQNISGLCPNTYYEFSAWIRNICPTCGVDSTGAQTYKPGVNPNLTFVLDDIDRYSTGEVDTLGGWLKKGFVFVTGPAQTSATFSIRNNGQGGGGNDWAMDDISVATCLPNMKYSPSLSPTVCVGNALTIYDTVHSYFNNYTYHQWQFSTDNGNNWTDLGGIRDSIPVFNPGDNDWKYITSYTIPPGNTTQADSGTLYRVLVATAASNLGNSSCQVTDGINIISLNVLDCTPVLKTDLLSFSGRLAGDKTHLSWTTSREDEPLLFHIERSEDGTRFTVAGSVSSHENAAAGTNAYSFVDPVAVAAGNVHYRLAIVPSTGAKKYSNTIRLFKDKASGFMLTAVINPFNAALDFEISTPSSGKIDIRLQDVFGKVVRKKSYAVNGGVNTLRLPDTGDLPAGTYIFVVKNDGQIITKKVVKAF